jgi:putative tryptophan/tyrosine transport system substrate-binding protein
MPGMRRRHFVALLGGAAAAWPLAARAQQPAVPVVGFLNLASPGPLAHLVAAFRRGLNDEGFVEGKNVIIEPRFAENQSDRLPALAAELIGRQVMVLAATGGTASGLAAKAMTTTVPVVFTTGDDPVKVGLVSNLSRPGGNLTGISVYNARLGTKRLGLLHEMLPAATTIAFVVNPNNPETEDEADDVREAARMLGIQILTASASTESDLDSAFATFVRQRVAAVIMASDTYFDTVRRNQVAELAVRHSLPSIHTSRAQAEAGGVISYGASIPGLYRQAGSYVGRILKGAKPADLPVQLPTKFELIINLKTAKVLRLDIPAMLLARADEVIE